jgi:formylglycine-generating enzyme
MILGNLCVAKMVPITGPNGGPNVDYKIDSTEVTKGQYDAWLATSPSLPASTDANCGYVKSYAEQGIGYTGTDADHHPVVYVDWCDAYEYCLGVDKRLCGAIGGGPLDFASYADATLSQWYRVCSSGGANNYPYVGAYQVTTCNGVDLAKGTTTAVGSLTGCQAPSPYAGVYDLSGNVFEWEDSCSGTGQGATCHIRGGAFVGDGFSNGLLCGYGNYGPRYAAVNSYGFRCCTP